MRTFALIPLLSLSLPALAGPISDKVGDVDEVVLEGTVTVPLYTDSEGKRRHHVLAEVPTGEDGDSRSFFFGLATSSKVIVVSDDFVKAAGLKPSTQNKKLINLKGEKAAFNMGGELKTVQIPTLVIGDLTLNDVSALVSSSKHQLGGVHYDLQIGLGAIPELAWAVLPTNGEVQFALADSDAGRALVADIGTPIGTSSTDWDDPKFGEDKVLASAATLLGPVQLGGAEITASFELASCCSNLSSTHSLTSTARRNEADRHEYWVDGQIGTETVHGWVLSTGSFNRGQYPNHQAIVGLNILSRFHVAANPSSQTMAIASVGDETIQWSTQTAERLAQAQAAVEAAKAESSEAEAKTDEGTDSAEQSGKAPPPMVALAKAQAADGDFSAAIDVWTQIVEIETDNCQHWMTLGQHQLSAGDASSAVASLEKSSELYRSWWDIDLETRTAVSDYRKLADSKKLKDVFKRMNMDEQAEDTPKEQAGSCHRADGYQAAAHLIQGTSDTVAQIYADRLDLDPHLAMVQGNASIQLGQTQAAHAAYRQAMIRESKPHVSSRMGLALAYIADEDWSTAEGHYLKALSINPNDSVWHRPGWMPKPRRKGQTLLFRPQQNGPRHDLLVSPPITPNFEQPGTRAVVPLLARKNSMPPHLGSNIWRGSPLRLLGSEPSQEPKCWSEPTTTLSQWPKRF